MQFETGSAPNFEFQLSGLKTEGGGITTVAPAVDRQPGLRREDSLVGANLFYLTKFSFF